ncbi:TetR family transcriptional regulator [Streptomyces sp. ITFR-6]|uniref:TetR family transcriptional regulator n=1 Tax=Streptomyces sp. ITFR-6 TaxID=3075197 RepID=UPI00288A6AE9|nr:TetR family transcriptional regulator [Streptomyces sp. ITFR-6]WNI27474.1 TetR family transcriptional regulator [Streptomyces sp. ITFR-6]
MPTKKPSASGPSERKKPSSPGLRERKKRATRNALAEAAVRLAAEHGVENVTVEAISEAAGVSPRTFFNYFPSHDDAFVLIDEAVGERIRESVRLAPAGRPPLDVVRDALTEELGGFERRKEFWALQAKVFQRSPHLIQRGLQAQVADQRALAAAIADWLDTGTESGSAGAAPDSGGAPASSRPVGDGLFPQLLAAIAQTAVRVAIEHWCDHPGEVELADTFQEVFVQLAHGLPRPPG